MAQKRTLRLDDRLVETEVRDGPDGLEVRLDDRWYRVDFVPTGRHELYSLLVDGRSWEVYAQPRPGGWDILIGNRVFSIETAAGRASGRGGAAPEAAGVWTLRSPLAGIVVETPVAVGDQVRAGQVVLVIESMKINNELKAARAGSVSAVYVQRGERVERGTPLVRVE